MAESKTDAREREHGSRESAVAEDGALRARRLTSEAMDARRPQAMWSVAGVSRLLVVIGRNRWTVGRWRDDGGLHFA